MSPCARSTEMAANDRQRAHVMACFLTGPECSPFDHVPVDRSIRSKSRTASPQPPNDTFSSQQITNT